MTYSPFLNDRPVQTSIETTHMRHAHGTPGSQHVPKTLRVWSKQPPANLGQRLLATLRPISRCTGLRPGDLLRKPSTLTTIPHTHMRRAHRERHAHDAVHSVVSRGLAPLLRFSPFVLWAPPILCLFTSSMWCGCCRWRHLFCHV